MLAPIGLMVLVCAAGARPGIAQDVGAEAERTLVLVRVESGTRALVRTLVLTDEFERLRVEGRMPMPTYERARGVADRGACFVADTKDASELTNEITCGGGSGIDTEFDPIGDLEDALDPRIDPDAGDGLDRDDAPDREDDRTEDYSSPGSAEASMDYGLGLKIKNGEVFVCGSLGGRGDCTDKVDLGSATAAGPTEEERRAMNEMNSDAESESTAEKASEFWIREGSDREGTEAEEEGGGSVIAEAVGKVFDWLKEQAAADESDEEESSTGDDSASERPQEGDVVTAPAECEDELAERLDRGGIEPIDPHPDDTGGAYVGCFVDATVVQDLAGCVIDLAARRSPDQGSLCAGQEVIVEVPLLTRNDLVIDDIAPGEVATSIALATELAARLAVLRAAEAGAIR